MTRIIQRYICRPLLLMKRKFDIRAYMLIAWTRPFIVLFHHGYLRLSLSEYQSDNFEDSTAHLTNQYQQKRVKDFSTRMHDSMWTMEQFASYLATDEGIDAMSTEAQAKFARYADRPSETSRWVDEILTSQMKDIMRHCFLSARPQLDTRPGFFDLLGFDFMIDDNLHLWLIEVNVNPALHTTCKPCQDLLPNMIRSVLTIELDIFQQYKKSKSTIRVPDCIGSFSLLFHEK